MNHDTYMYMYSIQIQGLKFSLIPTVTSPGLIGDDYLLAQQIQILAQVWKKRLCSPWKILFGLLVFYIFWVTIVL